MKIPDKLIKCLNLTLVISIGILLIACSNSEDDDENEGKLLDFPNGLLGIESSIVGEYSGNNDSIHQVTSSSWSINHGTTTEEGEFQLHRNSYSIVSQSSEGLFVIAQNGVDNTDFPAKFSRLEWHVKDDQLYYCHTIQDAESEEEALETSAARVDVTTAGCGDEAWVALEKVSVEPQGTFTDMWGSEHQIDQLLWKLGDASYHILEIDADEQWLISMNDSSNEFFPSKFSRFEWIKQGESIYYCQSPFAADSMEEARTEERADASDVKQSGCGGEFAWTLLNASGKSPDPHKKEKKDTDKIYVNRVVNYSPVRVDGNGGIYNEENIIGAPGGLVSLGFDVDADDELGGTITVTLGKNDVDYCVINGEGDDFMVLENPFVDPAGSTYTEAAYVAVSEDGESFISFPTSVDEEKDPGDVERYTGFAGISPDGDFFDLQTLIDADLVGEDFRACYITIIDAGTRAIDEDFVTEVTRNGSGADIDAIQGIHAEPASPEEEERTDLDSEKEEGTDLLIAGEYRDQWGLHNISSRLWSNGDSRYEVLSYDNDAMLIIAQNGAENAWNPEKYSRFEWTVSEDVLYYCQSVFDAESAADAEAAEGADAENLAEGCGGFSWTELMVGLSISGEYVDQWGTHEISSLLWINGDSRYEILSYDNDAMLIIAQNGAENAWNPEKYSRFEWTVSEDTLYYCQSVFDAESAADAEAAEGADAEDLTKGCGDFSWTKLTLQN